jgi:hypothetical protein
MRYREYPSRVVRELEGEQADETPRDEVHGEEVEEADEHC